MAENEAGVAERPAGPGIDLAAYRRPGGFGGQGFCSAPYPGDPYTWCRRMPGHEQRDDLGHAAYRHRISAPEYWPVQP